MNDLLDTTQNLVGSRIVGGNPEHGRRQSDYYPTPPAATMALLQFLRLPQGAVIWEPACGEGAMARVMAAQGYRVLASDLNDFGYGVPGRDFLSCDSWDCDWIITNPPFKLAAQFIERGVALGKPFALLMKAHYWNAARRVPLFREHPPSHVLPLTWRPNFTGGGGSVMDCSWYVWQEHTGQTVFWPLERPACVNEAAN